MENNVKVGIDSLLLPEEKIVYRATMTRATSIPHFIELIECLVAFLVTPYLLCCLTDFEEGNTFFISFEQFFEEFKCLNDVEHRNFLTVFFLYIVPLMFLGGSVFSLSKIVKEFTKECIITSERILISQRSLFRKNTTSFKISQIRQLILYKGIKGRLYRYCNFEIYIATKKHIVTGFKNSDEVWHILDELMNKDIKN